MAKNIALKTAIFASGIPQVEVASRTGIHYTKISMIVNGRREPSDDEKKAIARVLRKKVDHLFPEVAA